MSDQEGDVSRNVPEMDLNAAIGELNRVRKAWLKRPGVTAVDVGYKIKDGKMTDVVAVRVHVKRKLPVEALSETERFPEQLGAVPVDVIEAEYGPQCDEPA
jgi:hypothetical protein